MSALAERVREALHIGNFEPTSLEAEEKMLADAGDYANHVRRVEKAVRAFQKDTESFLEATGTFLTAAPYPRLWIQATPTQAAEAQHTAVPEKHAALFTAELQTRLAESVPLTLSAAIQSDIEKPLAAWLTAYEIAKERLPHLQRLRLEFDAARRRLESAADRAVAAEAGQSREEPQRAERRLGAREEEADPVMREFLCERAALSEHLTWMASAAARLKAYLADVAIAMRDAATSYTIPEGLLEPYPETARGMMAPPQAGAPQGAPTFEEAAPAPVPPQAATARPSTPPDAVSWHEGKAKPEGKGVGGFLADTLKTAVGIPTGPSGSVRPQRETQPPPATGGQDIIKEEDVVVGQHDTISVIPTTLTSPTINTASTTRPITDPRLQPATPAPTPTGAPSSATSSNGVPPTPPPSMASLGTDEPPYEFGDRPSKPYAGVGVGGRGEGEGEDVVESSVGSPRRQRECRMPDEATLGLGLRGRVLSSELPQSPTSGASVEKPPAPQEVQGKQLLPLAPVHEGAAAGAVAAPPAPTSSQAGSGERGGLLQAIKATVEEGGSTAEVPAGAITPAMAPAGEGDQQGPGAGGTKISPQLSEKMGDCGVVRTEGAVESAADMSKGEGSMLPACPQMGAQEPPGVHPQQQGRVGGAEAMATQGGVIGPGFYRE